MKKYIVLLLCLSLLFGVVGCGATSLPEGVENREFYNNMVTISERFDEMHEKKFIDKSFYEEDSKDMEWTKLMSTAHPKTDMEWEIFDSTARILTLLTLYIELDKERDFEKAKEYEEMFIKENNIFKSRLEL